VIFSFCKPTSKNVNKEKFMKLKKFIGIMTAIILSVTMMTVNVVADEPTDTSEHLLYQVNLDINENALNDTTDISELIPLSMPSSNQTNLNYEVANVDLENNNNSLISSQYSVSNIESSDLTTIPYELNENEPAIAPQFESYIMSGTSNAPPVSYVGVNRVWLGNDYYDPFNTYVNNPNLWEPVYYTGSDDMAANNLSLTIDSTGYDYIRFRIYQIGYSTIENVTMDDIPYVYSVHSGDFTYATGVVYGYSTDYMFEIPSPPYDNQFDFEMIYSQLSSTITGSASTSVDVEWSTPIGAAPTTPAITYNTGLEYAYVSGINNTMEYATVPVTDGRKDTQLNWSTLPQTGIYMPIYDDYSYIMKIRYITSTGSMPAISCSIPVKSRSEAPVAQSDFIYDDLFEILAVLNPMEIAIGDGQPYYYATTGSYDISSVIDYITTNDPVSLYLRFPATNTEPASEISVITLYERNPNVPSSVTYQNGMLCNLTSDMVIKFSSDDWWYSSSYSQVNVTSFMSTTSTTLVEIKYAPTANYSCSESVQITLPML
jgi:hypothetical protein